MLLINPVAKIVLDRAVEPFPVASPLEWIEEPEGYQRDWTYDGSFHPPAAPDIATVKRDRLDHITGRRTSALKSLTVEFNGATYDADETSVARMTNAITMLQMFAGDPRAPATVSWLDATNTPRTLTTAQLSELAAAAWIAMQTVWGKNHAAKVAIERARSIEAINAVEWPS